MSEFNVLKFIFHLAKKLKHFLKVQKKNAKVSEVAKIDLKQIQFSFNFQFQGFWTVNHHQLVFVGSYQPLAIIMIVYFSSKAYHLFVKHPPFLVLRRYDFELALPILAFNH